jgi:hypothetical protein
MPAITANTLADCIHPTLAYVPSLAMWINFTFITSGVLGGLAIGAFVREADEPRAIRTLTVVGTLALGALVLVTRSPLVVDLGDTPRLLAALLVLFSLAGTCCLGFFSAGLRAAVRVGAPVPHVYCAGLTELMSQLFAVGITQTSVCPVGFQASAACALMISGVLLCAARYPDVASSRTHRIPSNNDSNHHGPITSSAIPAIATTATTRSAHQRQPLLSKPPP